MVYRKTRNRYNDELMLDNYGNEIQTDLSQLIERQNNEIEKEQFERYLKLGE